MGDRVTLVSTTDSQAEVEAALGIKRPRPGAKREAPAEAAPAAPAQATATVTAPQTETPAEATPPVAETPAAAKPAETPALAAETKPEPPKPDAHRANVRKQQINAEIAELTERKYLTIRELEDAHTRVEQLRREAAELQARVQPATGQAQTAQTGEAAPAFEPTRPEPQSDDPKYGGDYNEFLKDLAKWSGEQAAIRGTREELAKLQRQQETDHRQRVAAAAQQEFAGKVGDMLERGRAAHADFDEVWQDAGRNGIRWSPFVQEVVAFHPLGHEIAYQLSQDPQESRRLSTLPTLGQAGVEMGRYIAKVEAQLASGQATAQVPAVPAAPPSPMTLVQGNQPTAAGETETPVVALPERPRHQPLSQIGGGPTTSTVDPSTMPAAQYRQWRLQQQRARRAG